jgi:hypothetical protein
MFVQGLQQWPTCQMLKVGGSRRSLAGIISMVLSTESSGSSWAAGMPQCEYRTHMFSKVQLLLLLARDLLAANLTTTHHMNVLACSMSDVHTRSAAA